MYKLIALDMDGTLLNPHGQITPRTHAAIAAARAQGVTVVLTSGRPLEGMTPYLAELGKSVSPATTGGKTVYRLRAAAGTAANAASLCGKLRVAGENCVVVR